jgi:hypothetical protein
MSHVAARGAQNERMVRVLSGGVVETTGVKGVRVSGGCRPLYLSAERATGHLPSRIEESGGGGRHLTTATGAGATSATFDGSSMDGRRPTLGTTGHERTSGAEGLSGMGPSIAAQGSRLKARGCL